jgi:hypothetical protein
LVGVTWTFVGFADATVRVVDADIPLKVAVIVLVPAASPVALPVVAPVFDMTAIAPLDDDQSADAVTVAVL